MLRLTFATGSNEFLSRHVIAICCAMRILTESNTDFYAMTTDNEGNPVIDQKYSNYTEYLFTYF